MEPGFCYLYGNQTTVMLQKRDRSTSGMEWNTMLGLKQRLQKDKQTRDFLLITLGCYFGLRIGDLLSLRWNDIRGKSEFSLTEQKTKKSRKITINPSVIEALNLCSKELKLETNPYIFSNRWGDKISVSYVNKRLKLIFKKYNVKVQNPSSHTLRKTFGKRIFESDSRSERSLIYLSEIFSHNSISTTRRYIGITEERISDIYLSL
jgi:integrase